MNRCTKDMECKLLRTIFAVLRFRKIHICFEVSQDSYVNTHNDVTDKNLGEKTPWLSPSIVHYPIVSCSSKCNTQLPSICSNCLQGPAVNTPYEVVTQHSRISLKRYYGEKLQKPSQCIA